MQCQCWRVEFLDRDGRQKSSAVCAVSVAAAVDACYKFHRYSPYEPGISQVLRVELVDQTVISPEGSAVRSALDDWRGGA